MRRFDAEDIRRYYDRHTPVFLGRGQGRGTGSIHRAVWGPGAATRREAFHYVHGRIADLTRALSGPSGRPRLLDLGCGVGASLCHLATQLNIHGTGVTLSPVQRRIAETRIQDESLSDRVRCIDGDFNALPDDVTAIDVAYAIESFVHGASPDRFLAECHRVIRPGGLLVICDDFVRPDAPDASRKTIDRFREGWHINTLISRDELVAGAQSAGFDLDSVTDLTPWLEIHRVRDRLLAAPAIVFDHLCRSLQTLLRLDPPLIDRANQRFGHLLGGHALQTCLAKGWVSYDFVVFRRR